MEKFSDKLLYYIRTTDKWLLFICLVISAFSCTIMYSISFNGFASSKIFYMQCITAVVGVFAAIIISLFDYKILAKMWPVFVPIALILVLLTWTSLGYQPPGSDDKAWLNLGITTFQPSELLKLAFIYTFSLHLSKVRERINYMSTFLLLCLHGAVPTCLIMLQGDMGSALVFFAIFVVLMFSAGLSWKFWIIGIVGGLIATPLIWNFVLPDYLQARFKIAWNPGSDPLGDGFQQYKGQVALGSGELTGRGLFTQGLYDIPARHNDFVFAYIGQTLGFVGCIAIALLLTVLCVKILLIAGKSKDDLGCFICTGIFAVILFQSVINIGMVLCVIPVIGITLPFVSGGGTSALISYMSIGMVLGVYRQNDKEMVFE